MKALYAFLLSLTLVFAHAGACSVKPRTVHLNGANTVIFSNEIDGVQADTILHAIVGKRLLLRPTETLYVVIVSGGGNYSNAMVMKEFLATMPNTQVICKYCASAAGMLFATFPKPGRLAIKSSEVLMHEMYMPKVTAKMVNEKTILAGLLIDSEAFNKLMRTELGMSRADYEAKIADTEWSVMGVDNVTLKLADEFVVLECDQYVKRLAPKTCE
jgi:ATP-dependent protease ClpP protease subunit